MIALGAIQPALAGGIGGLVEDCNGNPIAGAFVLITQPDGTFVRKGVTAGNGSFQFDFIDAGTYDVKVVCPNGKLLERRVTKGKGDQTRVRFVCPCTARGSGTVSGVEGAWTVEKSPFDSATLIFDSGRLEIRASSRGSMVRGQGTYRQLESNPSHPNEVAAGVYQMDSLGPQILMVEVDACGAESARQMHGFAPMFASEDNPRGSFVARRQLAQQ